MQISWLLGAALLAVSGAFAVKFRPRDKAGRALCVLLAVMGAFSLLTGPVAGGFLAAELLLAGVTAGCTAGVLALEERDRARERAGRRLAAQRAKEAGRRSLRNGLHRQRVEALYFRDDCPAA